MVPLSPLNVTIFERNVPNNQLIEIASSGAYINCIQGVSTDYITLKFATGMNLNLRFVSITFFFF